VLGGLCGGIDLRNLRRTSPVRPARQQPVGLANEIISSSENFRWMAGIYLDRLLRQRSAWRKPDLVFDLPPPRGGLLSHVK
jgi:hypothetical protein